MKQRYFLFPVLLLLCSFVARSQSSLEFIANQGQWNGPFSYKTITGRGDVYLAPDGFTYVLGLPSNNDLRDAYKHGQIKTPPSLKFHAYKMVFQDAGTPVVTGTKEQQNYYNYYLGSDPARWKTGIHPYLSLDYTGLYPGVSLHVASERGNLKYDFIVAPGSDPAQIKLRFDGADRMEIRDRDLMIRTSVGDVTELKPYAYQLINGEKKEVSCRYKLKGNIVSYGFPGGYDETAPLIIDPTVVFCTFTGSTSDNWGFTATYDAQGNFYAGGLVNGTGYPVSLGAFQLTFGGGSTTSGSFYPCDMGIMKLNPTGTSRVWATYIGGSDNDQPHSMIVDANDQLIIAGRTYSSNYPVTAGSFDNTYNGGADIVITKLNAAGTALVASTFVGGTGDDGVNFNADEFVFGDLKHNYGDDARSEVLIDNQANVYLTASTHSTNFPTTAGALQTTLNGFQDGVVIKLNSSLSALTWATYLGGSSDDAGYVLGLDNTQSTLYVGGGTQSSDFPSTSGTFWSGYQGGISDGFVAKFQNSPPFTLQKVSFIGQSSYDQVYGVQIDPANNVYVMGQTLGGTFPVTAGVYSNPNSSQFIMKLDADLSTNLLSTVFGSGDALTTNISPVAFLIDTCNNIYISGWGGGLGFSPGDVGNTFNMPLSVAPNTPAQSTTDGNDFYFIVLSPNAASLLYATYYGRNSADAGKGEHVDGGTSRFDKNGIVYQAICGGCVGNSAIPTTPFPTTAGSWSPNNGFPTNCNEVALKIAFQVATLKAEAQAGPDTAGCPPFTVTFTNNSTNAITYDWDFGDNSPHSSAATPPPHTYNIAGVYTVKLVVNNAAACNASSDTTIITIHVDSNSINSDFTYVVTDSCGPYGATFTNTSDFSSTPGSPAFTQFLWSFGDGTTFNGPNPGAHSYADTGCYTVRLIMLDSTSCNPIDTVEKIVCINGFNVSAGFNADSACLGAGVLFSNTSVNAQTMTWTFGDGQTSNSTSPVHPYAAAGLYTVTLVVTNPNSCNKIDSATATVKVKSLPIADFVYSPLIPVANMATTFTNKSINAVSYVWAFGDGTGSSDEHPVHLYKKTGTYTVCLEAKSADGCTDTLCKNVDAEVHPAVDVPTGFSPNGDGVNDILYVRGAAIDKLNFKVFNRWGELVFQTTDMNIGWDGTFKGKEQEMEAYAWTLDVIFIDETTAHKTGNVTLLR